LLQGAKDQVSELTGVELPAGTVIDQASETAADFTDAGQNLADTTTGAVVDAGETATGAITDANDK
jgi:hypothetical protein